MPGPGVRSMQKASLGMPESGRKEAHCSQGSSKVADCFNMGEDDLPERRAHSQRRKLPGHSALGRLKPEDC